MNTKRNTLYSTFCRLASVLFLWVFGMLVWASDPIFEWDGDNTITPESPSVLAKLLYGHTSGEPSYYDSTDDEGEDLTIRVYRNDTLVFTISDLDFLEIENPRGQVAQQKDEIDEKRSNDGIWKVFEDDDVLVVLYDPYGSGVYYWAPIEVLPLKPIHKDDDFKIEVKGYWMKDNDWAVDGGYGKVMTNTLQVAVDNNYFNKGTFSRPNGELRYSVDNLPALNQLKYAMTFESDGAQIDHVSKNANGTYRVTKEVSVAESNVTTHVGVSIANYENTSLIFSQQVWNKGYHLACVDLVKDKENTPADLKPWLTQTYDLYFDRETQEAELKGYAGVQNLDVIPDKWNVKNYLSWNNKNTQGNQEGKWLVSRYKKDGNNWVHNKQEEVMVGITTYTDADVTYHTNYRYRVTFMPKIWGENAGWADDLTETVETMIDDSFDIELRTYPQNSAVQLQWSCENIQRLPSDSKFHVFRYQKSREEAKEVGTVAAQIGKQQYSWTDTDLGECDVFTYYVVFNVFDQSQTSEEVTGSISGNTHVTTFNASLGEHSNLVKIWWEVENAGKGDAYYQLLRREMGNETDAWTNIYTVTGADNAYSYEDMAAQVGHYYEYKLMAKATCMDAFTDHNIHITDGFSLATGVVSGRITYGTGTAVSNVKITALPSSDQDKVYKQEFYSLRVTNPKQGLIISNEAGLATVFAEKNSFSLQMWLKLADAAGEEITLMDLYGKNKLYASLQDNGQYKLGVRDVTTNHEQLSDVVIPTKTYRHITYTYNHPQQQWEIAVVEKDTISQFATIPISEAITPLSIKGTNVVSQIAFAGEVEKEEEETEEGNLTDDKPTDEEDNTLFVWGYVDELRLWRKALSKEDIERNYGRILAGNEDYLAMYIPLDETSNNDKKAYDYSSTNGIYNNMHAKIGNGNVRSHVIPADDQLSNYALTNQNGEYVLRSLSVGKEGVTYNITPMMGVHNFTPASTARFVSNNSLVYSGIDFTDISSFPVSGQVLYNNTTYPVSGCQVLIDGQPASYNNKIVETDAEGKFTVSVPIGEHYISLVKEGHVFENGGRYPADPNGIGTTHTFTQPISNLTFKDVTMVVIAGKVAGGMVQDTTAVGFSKGTANIGQAVLKLTAGGRKLNVVEKVDGASVSYEPAATPLRFVPAGYGIKSETQAGAANEADVITITTDPESGEFAAWVPPIAYTIEKVQVKGNDMIHFESSVLDASNVLQKDTVRIGDLVFEYHALANLNYRSKPYFEVKDVTLYPQADQWVTLVSKTAYGAFGDTIGVCTEGTIQHEVSIYQLQENDAKQLEVKYAYEYPCFTSGKEYQFSLYGYESYMRYDQTPAVEDRIPLAGSVVSIENEFASTTAMSNDPTSSKMVGEVELNKVLLNSEGMGDYFFKAGLPNIQAPYTLNLNMSFTAGDKTYSWSENGNFKAIVLGAITSGTNFVTKGPDESVLVLRDPPGSNSYSSWETGTVHVVNSSNDLQVNGGIDVDVAIKTGMGMYTATGVIGFYSISDVDLLRDVLFGFGFRVEQNAKSKTTQYTMTNTQTISTSASDYFVGANGDTYFGASTNFTFGQSKDLGFQWKDGKAELGIDDIISVSKGYETTFAYTQYYIINTLLPNLTTIRNGLLLPVGTDIQHYDRSVSEYYVSNLPESDAKYGSCNNDKKVWGDKAVETSENTIDDDCKCIKGPSYTLYLPQKITESVDKLVGVVDSVAHCNAQMDNWKQIIANNEQRKYEAIQQRDALAKEGKVQNISFDAGATYTSYTETVEGKGKVDVLNWQVPLYLGGQVGFAIKKVLGFDVKGKANLEFAGHDVTEDYTDSIKVTKYELAESGFSDALSVDVYTVAGEASPIFSTRGGQTSCPYEGAEQTKYYNEGTVISQATMQIEVPRMQCDEPIQTDVPAGRKAYYTVVLQNNSEIASDLWYDLGVSSSSNPNGAVVLIDGIPATRSVLIPGGKSITKTVTIEQGDPSIMDYEVKLFLSSQCQSDPTSPNGAVLYELPLAAHFVPTCAQVDLQVSTTLLNQASGDTLNLTLTELDTRFVGLEDIQLQYKTPLNNQWITFMGYYAEGQTPDADNWLPLQVEEGSLTYRLPMSNPITFPDQTYQFRVISTCQDGVEWQSEPIEVVKDMQAPAPLVEPSPADGIYQVGDQLGVVFNEPINTGTVNSTENIQLKGLLNERTIDHAVAFHAAGGAGATTEAVIDLSKRSFAINLWLYYTDSGVVVSHGTRENGFQLRADKDNTTLAWAGKTISAPAMPTGKWLYVNLSVENTSEAAVVSLDYAYDATEVNLIDQESLDVYQAQGTLTLGEGLVGAIHEVSLWNTALVPAESFSQKSVTKKAYTPHLIGYWPFNEGNGLVAKDLSRYRDMVLPNANAWKYNSDNYALQLNGQQYATILLGARPTVDTDNYMLEFWFKADSLQQTFPVSLLTVGNNLLDLKVAPAQTNTGASTAKQMLYLTARNKDYPLSAKTYMDNAWHHVAINVFNQTQGVSMVYIDGNVVRQFDKGVIPGLQADSLMLGAGLVESSVAQCAKVSFDELRYWKGTYTAHLIRENMHRRMQEGQAGLLAYYPFETVVLDDGHQVQTKPSLADRGEMLLHEAQVKQQSGTSVSDWNTTDTPPLKAAPMMQEVPFDMVVGDRTIYITPTADLSQIENVTLQVTVKEIQDVSGNKSAPIRWNALVQQNPLKWENSIVEERIDSKHSRQIQATILNTSGQTQEWSLVGIPAWLTASSTFGSLAAQASETVYFTVSEALTTGTFDATILLDGENGVSVPLNIRVVLVGELPEWQVETTQFVHTMGLVAKLIINGKLVEDPNCLLAAFVGDTCIGVGNPQYVKRYDTYFVVMNLYGDAETPKQSIRFKAYDATTGVIHPNVEASQTMIFEADKMKGSYGEPIRFVATNDMVQNLSLNEGWNWVSFYVSPADTDVNSLLSPVAGTVTAIKGHAASLSYNASKNKWQGDMDKTLNPLSMYKMYAQQPVVLPITGPVTAWEQVYDTIQPGWNWISYPLPVGMPVSHAFAAVTPQDGDVIKSQHQFSLYDGYEWIGLLQVLLPGQGYVYASTDSTAKRWQYPQVYSAATMRSQAVAKPTAYPSNMGVVAVVKDGDQVVSNAIVEVYDNKRVLRGQSKQAVTNNLHFVTIQGQGRGEPLQWQVQYHGKTISIPQSFVFQEDTLLGSLKAPYVLSLNVSAQNQQVTLQKRTDDVWVSAHTAIQSLQVYDVAGRMVYQAQPQSATFAIPMNAFENGVYVIEVKLVDAFVHTQKVIW